MNQLKSRYLCFTLCAISALAGCGGGGGGGSSSGSDSTTNPATASTFDIESVPASDFGSVNLATASQYSGSDNIWYDILTTGDVNGDGYDDVVVGLNRTVNGIETGAIKPVVLFFNPSTKTYSINSQVQSAIPAAWHPRQASILDLNGDGKNDLFIANHGYDSMPYGYPNELLLNQGGTYADGAALLPKYIDFSHGLVVDDFNGDGKKDLLVLNNNVPNTSLCTDYPAFTDCPSNTYTPESHSYVLFQNGGGTLTTGILNLDTPSDLNFTVLSPIGQAAKLTVGATSDFNKDGIVDLVVADHTSISILESRSGGNYKSAIKFSPPSAFVNACSGGITPYSYIATYDINGDGVNEIFASYTCDFSKGQAFQVLQRSSAGVWADISNSVFPNQSVNQPINSWCYKLVFEDIDGDGQKDLICENKAGFGNSTNNVFWLQDKGVFAYRNLSLKSGNRTIFHSPIILNGVKYLLGFSADSQNNLKVTGWKLIN